MNSIEEIMRRKTEVLNLVKENRSEVEKLHFEGVQPFVDNSIMDTIFDKFDMDIYKKFIKELSDEEFAMMLCDRLLLAPKDDFKFWDELCKTRDFENALKTIYVYE